MNQNISMTKIREGYNNNVAFLKALNITYDDLVKQIEWRILCK